VSNLIKDTIKERQKLNKELIRGLEDIVEPEPTMRFGQILMNYFWDNDTLSRHTDFESKIYNEEPAKTLATLSRKK